MEKLLSTNGDFESLPQEHSGGDIVSNISRIDKNFVVQTNLNIDNIRFYSLEDERISLYGVFYENGMYRRLPERVAESVSEGVNALHIHTAGGRVKFATDSSFVAIKAVMSEIGRMSHFALSGSSGFDMYVGENEEYYNSFIPPYDLKDGYENVICFDSRKRRDITINFPLYSGVSQLYIGLENDALLEKSCGYKYEKPIVFYGSSITQGGCASRPGNSYESIVSRELKADYINLGFSGNAKAEDSIAEYISSLEKLCFVYDYDYNAPSVEHLENTHQKMFLRVRESNPDLPIIILSRPKYILNDEEKIRLEIIENTYNQAIASGDKNVYFISGRELMEYAKNDGTVDGCHPNDLGFYSMARPLIKLLKDILKTE